MTPPNEPHAWATPGRSALAALLSVLIGLVGLVLSPWPPVGATLSVISFALLALAILGARASRRRANGRAAYAAAIAASVGNLLAALLVVVSLLSGAIVGGLVTLGSHASGSHARAGSGRSLLTDPGGVRPQEVVVGATVLALGAVYVADAICQRTECLPEEAPAAPSTEHALGDRAVPFLIAFFVAGSVVALVWDSVERGELPRFTPVW